MLGQIVDSIATSGCQPIPFLSFVDREFMAIGDSIRREICASFDIPQTVLISTTSVLSSGYILTGFDRLSRHPHPPVLRLAYEPQKPAIDTEATGE